MTYYMVTDDSKYPPLGLYPAGEIPEIMVLSHGDASALFNSYEDARNAIRRSQRLAKRNGYLWGPYHIVRAETVEPAEGRR